MTGMKVSGRCHRTRLLPGLEKQYFYEYQYLRCDLAKLARTLLYLGQEAAMAASETESKERAMKTLVNRNTGIAAFAAVVIVGLTGLTLDRGHDGALPKGVIEVGNPEAIEVGDLIVAKLPAVEVTGTRVVQLADAVAHAEPQG